MKTYPCADHRQRTVSTINSYDITEPTRHKSRYLLETAVATGFTVRTDVFIDKLMVQQPRLDGFSNRSVVFSFCDIHLYLYYIILYNKYRTNLKPKEFMKVLNPNNLPTAPISEFSATQGDLKFLSEENYKKLKGRIEARGFNQPVTVWIDKNGVKHLLDGHQRQRVLTTEGWNNPIPYLKIEAKSIEEAAEILLEVTSQYGTITQEGIDEFIATFELPEMAVLEHTNFDGIFNFDMPTPEEPQPELEVEPEVEEEVVSVKGTIYALGSHRVACGDPRDAEVPPEKMDAYRKKYQRIITGSEDGWESATPAVEEEL